MLATELGIEQVMLVLQIWRMQEVWGHTSTEISEKNL
jgi:hypothetical protein